MPDILRVKSDKASDGDSDKVEFTKTKKEKDTDDRILETISLRKPLLKYKKKIMNDNVHAFYFHRRLELKDIIDDHNQSRVE